MAEYRKLNTFTTDLLRFYTLPYLSNPPFLISWHLDTLALSPEHQSARMSKTLKNGGLDQYGAGPFEQQQFATDGVEGVNIHK